MVLGTTGTARPRGADQLGTPRARELHRAERLLDEGARLVTLTGPAGVGKSWVAHQLVRRLTGRASGTGHAVVEVRIASARSRDDLLVSVADAMSLAAGIGVLRDRLAAALAGEHCVVVVDDGDRLDDDPHPVTALFDLDPRVQVVATGLGPLHVDGEEVVGLDPLDVPRASAAPDEVRESPAVQLYLRRAAQVDHAFAPDRADLASIGELCRRVNGLPLGIELMAMRVGEESPAATLEYLDSGREITRAPGLAVDDPHHLSLRRALAWSYGALDPFGQRLLRRMSVFVGPVGADMLACVARLGRPSGSPTYSEVLDVLSDLVDRRLVEPRRGPVEPGFVLVPLLREFAREKLVDAGEEARAEQAHTRAVIEHVVSRVDAVEAVRDDAAEEDLARTEADLRLALRRLVGSASVGKGLRLATALAPFVLWRGYDGFVGPALGSLLRHATEDTPDDEPDDATEGGTEDATEDATGDGTDDATDDATGGRASGDAGDSGGRVDPDLVARGVLWKARLAVQFEGPPAAEDVARDLARAVRLARRAGSTRTLLLALSFVVQALPVTGDLVAAEEAAEEGLALAIASGEDCWTARFCAWSGMVANQDGHVEQALARAGQGVGFMEASGDPRAQVLLGLLLAGLPGDRVGGLWRHLPPVDELIEISARLEPRYKPFVVRMAVAQALRSGEPDMALVRCADCLRLAQRQAAWHDVPFAILLLSLVAVRRGDLTEGARLHGMVARELDLLRLGLPTAFLEEYTAELAAVRGRLGGDIFEDLVRQGADLTRAAALDVALAYVEGCAPPRPRTTAGWGPSSNGEPAYAVHSWAGEPGPPPDPAAVPEQRGPVPAEQLTRREREVLVELITGATNKEISRRLGMAPKTVMHHSVAIYRKLGVRGRAEATAWAFRNGMVN